MLIRMFSASAALAIAVLFAAIAPASARPTDVSIDGQPLAQSTVNPQPGSNTLPDPNSPGATSDPDVLRYPRDQRDGPPPAGLEVAPDDSRSGMMTSFQEARLLDSNLPGITSNPALLRLPRDQRDGPPPGLQADLRREIYGTSQIPANRISVQDSQIAPAPITPAPFTPAPIGPSRSMEDVQRDPLGLEPLPGQVQPGTNSGDSLNRSSVLDPNNPGTTSDPALLGEPRDQRDAPPVGVPSARESNDLIPANPGSSGMDSNMDSNRVNFNQVDPNNPGATSDPSVLGAPRDQRDAPPTNTIGQ